MIHARTIHEAANWFKTIDPETCLTENAIRTLILSGRVPSAQIGKKYVVTIEALEEYLRGERPAVMPETAPQTKRKWRIE